MKKEWRNRRVVKIRVRTPGGRIAIHVRKPIHKRFRCTYCGRKISKGIICPSCERKMVIEKLLTNFG